MRSCPGRGIESVAHDRRSAGEDRRLARDRRADRVLGEQVRDQGGATTTSTRRISARSRASSRSFAQGGLARMLMSLLYAQAESAARAHGARLSRRAHRLSPSSSSGSSASPAGSHSAGIGAGDAVALVLPDDPWFVTSFHAITSLGAIVVPVNPAFKQAELEFNFPSAGVSAMISDERAAGVCERIAAGLTGAVEVISHEHRARTGPHPRRTAHEGSAEPPRCALRRGDVPQPVSPRDRPAGPSGSAHAWPRDRRGQAYTPRSASITKTGSSARFHCSLMGHGLLSAGAGRGRRRPP